MRRTNGKRMKMRGYDGRSIFLIGLRSEELRQYKTSNKIFQLGYVADFIVSR
jgi:hypothetical protein